MFFTLTPIYKKKGAKSRPWALSTNREGAQVRDLAPFFGDWSQSEKPFEIKPLLVNCVQIFGISSYP